MSAYLRKVKDILGKDMFRKLRTIVAEGKISQAQAETFAYELDSRVGGKFRNRSHTSGFEYNANAFMAILGDFYEIAAEQKRENLSEEIIRIINKNMKIKSHIVQHRNILVMFMFSVISPFFSMLT